VSRDWFHEGTLPNRNRFATSTNPRWPTTSSRRSTKISPRPHRTLLHIIKRRSVTATPSHLVTRCWAGLRISSTSYCRLRLSSPTQLSPEDSASSWCHHWPSSPMLIAPRGCEPATPSKLLASTCLQLVLVSRFISILFVCFSRAPWLGPACPGSSGCHRECVPLPHLRGVQHELMMPSWS